MTSTRKPTRRQLRAHLDGLTDVDRAGLELSVDRGELRRSNVTSTTAGSLYWQTCARLRAAGLVTVDSIGHIIVVPTELGRLVVEEARRDA